MCPFCNGFGCKIDCANAPWNWDRPRRVSKFVFLMRFARWKREIIPFCSYITWSEIAWTR